MKVDAESTLPASTTRQDDRPFVRAWSMAPAPDVSGFRLTDLPVEVVVHIFAIAARDAAADEDQGWLCGLARTSRLVWRVVKPVLYETVVIGPANCDHVLSGMLRSRNFLATRSLLINALAAAHERFSTLSQLIARSFAGVAHVACTQPQLCDFMAAHERFRPPRFTCLGPFQPALWARAATDLPYLAGITHISLAVARAPPVLLPFTHVVLTVLAPDVLPSFVAACPRLRRVAVYDTWGSHHWRALLAELARAHGERRIALIPHAEYVRLAELKLNRGLAAGFRPLVAFEDSLWTSGEDIRVP
ncbi:hypothetical protein AURDEDRAFT_161411 [Auricularia subglabra TFB-10046 SS5]|nr:hypothetical protein AURDEDRAFT_161411 [Auricularia subglabra TFB-10046 SS5]